MVAIAEALRHLGFVPLVDFVAANNGVEDQIVRWISAQPMPSAAAIAAAMLPAAKEQKLGRINAECRSRLIARFGDAAEQVSRAMGIYGAAAEIAHKTGVAATIDATNVARNQVIGAANITLVEEVAVTWPVI